MTLQHSSNTPTARDALPVTIRTYLKAHAARESATALSTFTAAAVVTDDGQNYHGHDDIRSWLDASAGEYTHTTDFTSATTADTGTFNTSKGTFPGVSPTCTTGSHSRVR